MPTSIDPIGATSVDLETAIKAKTDNLPSDPADQSILAGLITAVDDLLDTEMPAVTASLAAAVGGSNNATGTSQQTSGTGGLGSFSAYTQIIASTTKASPFQSFAVSVRNGNAAGDKVLVQVAIGGSGSEVVIAQALFILTSNAVSGEGLLTINSKQQIPAGTRLAYRSSCEGATGADVGIAWTVGQVA